MGVFVKRLWVTSGVFLMLFNVCAQPPFFHDLHLEFLPKQVGSAHARDLTVHLHGWGLNGSDLEDLVDMLPGTVVTFDLPDAPRDRSSDFKILSKMIPKTSSGQLPEVLITVWVLRQALHQHNPELLFLAGCSRGGSLALNTAYFLLLASGRCAPVTREDVMSACLFRRSLQRIGVTIEECGVMLDKLLRGGLIMDCPPANINRLFTKENIRMILPFALPESVVRFGLRWMTRYRLDGMQAEHSLARINELCPQLNCLLHMEKYDRVVGGAQKNAAFVQALLGRGCRNETLGIRIFHEGEDEDGHFYDRYNSSLSSEVADFLREVDTRTTMRPLDERKFGRQYR